MAQLDTKVMLVTVTTSVGQQHVHAYPADEVATFFEGLKAFLANLRADGVILINHPLKVYNARHVVSIGLDAKGVAELEELIAVHAHRSIGFVSGRDAT